MALVQREYGKRVGGKVYCISRPSRWANPFRVGRWYRNSAWLRLMFIDMDFKIFNAALSWGIYPKTEKQTFDLYRVHIETKIRLGHINRKDFEGLAKYDNLSCWCKGEYCHYHVLKQVAQQQYKINL